MKQNIASIRAQPSCDDVLFHLNSITVTGDEKWAHYSELVRTMEIKNAN